MGRTPTLGEEDTDGARWIFWEEFGRTWAAALVLFVPVAVTTALASMPEKALDTARARFGRPAFFARHCPRIVDRLYGRAEQRHSVG